MASSDADIALVANTEAEIQQRVLAVLRYGTWWATQATAEQKQQSLSTAGGSLATIAQIIREDWPAGADFGSSDHLSDRVLELDLQLDPAVLAWGPVSGQRLQSLTGKASSLLRSLRRSAADTLAVIIQDNTCTSVVIQRLVSAGFFDEYLFPSMMCGLMTRFWPVQTYQVAAACPDQGQGLAFSLMRVAVAACRVDIEVARLVLREAMLGMVMSFQDPWEVKHLPQTSATRGRMSLQSANRQVSHLPRSSPTRQRRELLPPGMTQQQAAAEARWLQLEAAADGMPQLMAALIAAVMRGEVFAKEDMPLVVALFDHAHIDCKVDRLLHCCELTPDVYAALSHSSQLMSCLWLKRAEIMSTKAREEYLAGPVAKAAALRQRGNTAFKNNQFQAALTSYRSALHHTPADAVLYSNIALVQHKLGNINEAHNAAWCALGHDATSSKAWVRLGDTFRDVSRWQLAQLCYQTALKLQQDPAVQERHAAAMENIATPWDWDEIPVPWDTAAVGRWLGCGSVVRQDLAAITFERLNSSSPHAHLSRYMAVHLKQLQLTAEAMRRARAGHMQGLPAMHEWQCGYSDTPFTGRCSGAIKHMVRASDAAVYDPTALHAEPLILCEGKPSCNNILQAIALSCLYAPKGNNGRPYKPGSLKISYRMLYMYAELAATLEEWGISPVVIETQAETDRAAMQCNTDSRGINYAGMYKAEKIFDLTGSKKKDSNNGQRASSAGAAGISGAPAAKPAAQQKPAAVTVARADKDSGGSANAAAVAAASSDSSTQQQQRRLRQQPAAAAGSNSSSSNVRQQPRQQGQPGQLLAAPDMTYLGSKVQTISLDNTCRQGRVGGQGAWEPGAQDWIRVLGRARAGLSMEGDRAWVQQEAQQLQQRHEQRKLAARQQAQDKRRQRQQQQQE